MLPCSMRRRSWSADESMSSSWSALRTTQSGTRSRTVDTGDPFHRVGQRLEVLDVDGGDHRDPGVEDLEHVLPPLLVTSGSGHVGVGQLVDRARPRACGRERRRGPSPPRLTPVFDLLAGHDGEVAELLHGVRAPVRLDETHDDVGAALEAAPSLVEHGDGLADPGRRTQVHPEAPGRRTPFVSPSGSLCVMVIAHHGSGTTKGVGTLGYR